MYMYSKGKEKKFHMVSKEILQFMKDEFNLTREGILNLSDKEYDDLFHEVLGIESYENLICDGKLLSKRGRIAGEVLSIMYY